MREHYYESSSILIKNQRSKNAIMYTMVILCLSLTYKIAIPTNTIAYNIAEKIVSIIPYSEITRLTSYLSVLSIPILAMMIQFFVTLLYIVMNLKQINFKIGRRSTWLVFLLIVRWVSSIASTGRISIFDLGFSILFIALIFIINQINQNDYKYFVIILNKTLVLLATLSAFSALYYSIIIIGSFELVVFRMYRITGIIYDPIYAGMFYSIGLLSAFNLILMNEKYILISNKIILYISIACIFVAGLLSGSRSYIYFMGLAVLFHVSNKKGIKKILLFTFIIIFLFLLVTNYITQNNLSMTQDQLRSEKWSVAWEAFKSNPIFGVGTNQYREYERNLGLKGSNPHNIILQVISENGLVGAFMLLGWLIPIVISKILNPIKRIDFYLVLSLILVLTSMIVGVLHNMLPMVFFILITWSHDKQVTKFHDNGLG